MRLKTTCTVLRLTGSVVFKEEEAAVIYGPCLGKRCRQAFFFFQLLNRNGHSMMKSICGCRSVKRADESFEEMADRRNMPSAVLVR
ncbi:hypothetical protein B296_00030726 [Ensete ventricosum]|uniref:Uncharacterized protein n=1 Tax=Ensete ventricosum TaxID=4639 RepID=A0A426X4N5_ENSVE|nr:hypothetical protein B296_00030726 [Ensete ventricosum]